MEQRIIVQQTAGDNMGSAINNLLQLLIRLDKVQPGDSIIIDITRVRFAHPILILPLTSLIARLRDLGFILTIQGGSTYLNTILFPDGFNAINISNWEESLNHYRDRTYLPICQVPSTAGDFGIRENLLTVFESIMRYQLNITGQLLTTISYLISEAMDNIVDHAGVGHGLIMVQNYPSKHFLDICMLDNGVGIRGSYVNNGFAGITSDEMALQQAINGRSTKHLAETRGYGINTSRRMLVDGIGGKYFLFSGAAFYLYSNEMEQIIRLKRSCSWNGTMLALRIPRDIPVNFNYADYLG